jgi:hypothetical protein
MWQSTNNTLGSTALTTGSTLVGVCENVMTFTGAVITCIGTSKGILQIMMGTTAEDVKTTEVYFIDPCDSHNRVITVGPLGNFFLISYVANTSGSINIQSAFTFKNIPNPMGYITMDTSGARHLLTKSAIVGIYADKQVPIYTDSNALLTSSIYNSRNFGTTTTMEYITRVKFVPHESDYLSPNTTVLPIGITIRKNGYFESRSTDEAYLDDNAAIICRFFASINSANVCIGTKQFNFSYKNEDMYVGNIPSANWNIDSADNSGQLPVIDINEDNAYEIFITKNQVIYSILHKKTGLYVPVHRDTINRPDKFQHAYIYATTDDDIGSFNCPIMTLQEPKNIQYTNRKSNHVKHVLGDKTMESISIIDLHTDNRMYIDNIQVHNGTNELIVLKINDSAMLVDKNKCIKAEVDLVCKSFDISYNVSDSNSGTINLVVNWAEL